MPEKVKRRGLGGWLFLTLVLIAYGLLSLVEPEAASSTGLTVKGEFVF